MLPGLPLKRYIYRFWSSYTVLLFFVYNLPIFNLKTVFMLVVKLFIYFFSLLNRKFNKDSKNALKRAIFLLQIIFQNHVMSVTIVKILLEFSRITF